MNLVVGSGPTGVACAKALLDRGQKVTLLDAGCELEDTYRDRRNELAQTPIDDWDPAWKAELNLSLGANSKGIPLKKQFGSDFPFRHTKDKNPWSANGVEAYASFAVGGLSNVWGGAILPYGSQDLTSWPIDYHDLRPHYQAVSKLMPLSAVDDGLSERFEMFSSTKSPLALSTQARVSLSHMEKHREKLRAKGVCFGQARLAVQNLQKNLQCQYCGLCLSGCPWALIYNSNQTLEDLKKHPKFQYRTNAIVQSVSENKTSVGLVVNRNGETERMVGDRVFMACGPILTTRLLLQSLNIFNKSVSMASSQHFVLPWVSYENSKGVETERLHTLSQLFIELQVARLSQETIHLQVYSYSEIFAQALKVQLRAAYPLLKTGLDRWLMGRLSIIQGYLHSNDSTPLKATLSGAGTMAPVLNLTATQHGSAQRLSHRVSRWLGRNRNLFGAYPLGFALKLSEPGGGSHFGGSFPMSQRPGALQSDIWGRPFGLKRVHAVDTTIFPTVAAPTITLTAMANAHRIGSEFPLDS